MENIRKEHSLIVVTQSLGNETNIYLDEQWKMSEAVDRKAEVANLKKVLPKKKTPAYVEQFGVNKKVKKICIKRK